VLKKQMERENNQKLNSRIAIMGSGLAGAYVNYRLKKAGFTNIDIYEKQSVKGGVTFDAKFNEKTSSGRSLKTFPASNMFMFMGFYSIVMEEMKKFNLKPTYVKQTSVGILSWTKILYIIGGIFSYNFAWLTSRLKKKWFMKSIKEISKTWKFETFKDTILTDIGVLFGEYSPAGEGNNSKGDNSEGNKVTINQAESYYLFNTISPRIILIFFLNKIIPHIFGFNFSSLLDIWLDDSNIIYNSKILSVIPLADRVLLNESEYDHVFVACEPWDFLYDIDLRFKGRYNYCQTLFFEGVVQNTNLTINNNYYSYYIIDNLVKPNWYRLMHIICLPFYGSNDKTSLSDTLEEIKNVGFKPQHDEIISYNWKIMKGCSKRKHYFDVYNKIHNNVHLVGMQVAKSPLLGVVVEEIDKLLEKKFNIKSEKPSVIRNWYLSFRCMYQSIFG
jgi:hypothetical protein